MADTNRGLQFGVSALQRARIVVAAILLMLHWAAPNTRPFEPLPKAGGSAPAVSTAPNAFVTGTVPRAVARMQPLEQGMAKPGRSLWQGGGEKAALLPNRVRHGAAHPAALPDAAVSTTALLRLAHEFKARAPPLT